GKLEFVVRADGKFDYSAKIAGGFTPLEWLQGLAQHGAVSLPSSAEPYASVDQLAEEIRSHIHKYFDCPQQFESVATLYVLMTWLSDLFHAVPYLRFLGISVTGRTRASE